jgi:hypothetical protein
MVEAIYLALLAFLLAGFLFYEKIPRPIAVEIWCNVFLVFVICFFISLQLFNHYANKYEDGIWPFLPPIIPALGFLMWRLRRVQRRQ